MKKEDLSAAISYIDIKFICEAEECDMKTIKIHKTKMLRLLIAAIVVCLLLSITAFAGITVTGWKPAIFFDGNKTQVDVGQEGFFKELPDNLPVPKEGECRISMSKLQLEELLGFSILGSELSDEDILYSYSALCNFSNSSVATVDLWCPEFITESETKYISMSVDILSADAEQGFIDPFKEGPDAAGGKIYLENYCAAQSGFDAVIYTYDDMPSRLTAVFVYDDVYYSIKSDNYSIEELKAVLDTLK